MHENKDNLQGAAWDDDEVLVCQHSEMAVVCEEVDGIMVNVARFESDRTGLHRS